MPDEFRRGNKHSNLLDTVDGRLNDRCWNKHHGQLFASHRARCASADFGFQGHFRNTHRAAEAWCENRFPLLWVRYSRHAHYLVSPLGRFDVRSRRLTAPFKRIAHTPHTLCCFLEFSPHFRSSLTAVFPTMPSFDEANSDATTRRRVTSSSKEYIKEIEHAIEQEVEHETLYPNTWARYR